MWLDMRMHMKCEDFFLSLTNAHQKASSTEKALNNQVDKITWSVDVSHPSSSATLELG